jgi:hypothetical protein
MDQVQPVIVEETIKEEEETAQTPKRSRRVAAVVKANTPKMDNVQGDLKTPAAASIRTIRTLTTDGTNVENVDMFIQCPCNVARIRITPCFKAAEVPAAVVPAITTGSAAKRRRGGRRPKNLSTDAALSPRRRTLRRLRKNI